MTMHLVRGMTSLNTKKQHAKKKTAKQIAAEVAHEATLKRLGVGRSPMPTDKYGKRVGIYEIPDYSKERQGLVPTSNKVAGNGAAKERNVYTGTEIMGIGTMHKSNAVPIRRDSNDAIDIANMRRN